MCPRRKIPRPCRPASLDSREVVVHQPDLDPLGPLSNDDIPAVPPLALDGLEPPDLPGRPVAIQALDIALEQALAGGARRLPLARQPPAGQELVLDVGGGRDPVAAAPDAAEQPVGVLAPLAVDAALLRRALDARGRELLDLDVRRRAGRLGRRRGDALVLLDVQRDRRQADRLARQPPDALQRQRRVRAVGEGLVLRDGEAEG